MVDANHDYIARCRTLWNRPPPRATALLLSESDDDSNYEDDLKGTIDDGAV